FRLKIGARVFVVLTDYGLIKSAFQKHEISGRPFYFHYNTLKKSSHYDRRYNVDDEYIKNFSQLTFDMFEDMEGPMALLTVFPWMIPILPDFIKNKWMRVASLIKKREEILCLLKMMICLSIFMISSSRVMRQLLQPFAGFSFTWPNIKTFRSKFRNKLTNMYQEGKKYLFITKTVNRHVSFLPNALPHEVTEDIIFEGYDIPKGTIMVPDMVGCHKNPKYWKYPNDFTLENFLDEERNIIRSKEGYLPFSLGRRVCLGESLAKMELFVFMGSVLQNFEISEPEGQNVSLTPRPNINLFNYAPKFKVILKARN
ncbi:Cytochrome P450 2L1, partial [Armadillidium nasatum]